MPAAIVLHIERYRLFQQRINVTKQQHIHFGRNQQMLLTESVQDNNFNKEVSLWNII